MGGNYVCCGVGLYNVWEFCMTRCSPCIICNGLVYCVGSLYNGL